MELNQQTDALVIIDMQPDFAMPGGNLYVKDGEKIIHKIITIATRFEQIFLTQDNHPSGHKSFASSHEGKKPFDVIEMYGHDQVLWPDHCIKGTQGNVIVPALWPESLQAIAIIRKGMNPNVDSYSAFRENFGPNGERANTGFGGLLRDRGIKRLFFVGLARDYCVRFSAEDGASLGFESYVVEDLTKSVVQTQKAEQAVTDALTTAGVKLITLTDLDITVGSQEIY